MTIGGRIQAQREKFGWSQEVLAEKLGVSRQSVSKWELGQSLPEVDKIIEMSGVFGISTDELLVGDREKKNWFFNDKQNICSLRVAGVLLNGGKILLQREKNGNEYAVPGGLIKFGETSADALTRKYKEETGADIVCGRVIWSEETFWTWGGKEAHSITFYYLISLKNNTDISENSAPQKNNKNVILEWLPVDGLKNLTVFPAFIKNKIENISGGTEHFICFE